VIAGTLAQFDDPAPEPIEPFLGPGEYPAVTVETTQETVDAATPQTGQVAGRVKESRTDVFTGEDDRGEPFIEVDREDTVTPIATDWYADVTGAGIVLAESIAENVELPFPFDVFGGVTEQPIERQQIDVAALYKSWQAGGGLNDVWMAGTDEILPFAEAWDPDEHEDQTDFEEFRGGGA